MSCTNCLNTKINSCVNEIYVDLSLTANTTYIAIITDHFGNEYYATVTTDADGGYYLYMDNSYPYTDSDFPEGLFNNPVTLTMTTESGDPIEFESGADTYDCFTTSPLSNQAVNVIQLEGYPVVIEGECCNTLTIEGTPYYHAMFNTLGDNVEDSNLFQSVISNSNYFWFESPDGNSGLFQFQVDNNPDLNSIYVGWSVGNLTIDSEASTGPRLQLTDGSGGSSLKLQVIDASDIPTITLHFDDSVNTNTARIFNNDNLTFEVSDNKQIFFKQNGNTPYIRFDLISTDSALSLISDVTVVIDANNTEGYLYIYNSAEDSYIDIFVAEDGTSTYFEMFQNAIEIFKVTDAGISTDASANTWQLGAAAAGAPTVDTNITVTINGTSYLIAAEAV